MKILLLFNLVKNRLIQYRFFQQNDFEEMVKLIKQFYHDSPGNDEISKQKIKKTFHEFTIHPEKGTMIICEYQNIIVGYAILFFGWSNQKGKNIVFIDELYVKEDFRKKGIATGCIHFIQDNFKKNAASIMLAVEQGNNKVEKFYKKLDFKDYKNKTLVYTI